MAGASEIDSAPQKASLSFGGIKGRARAAVTVQHNGTDVAAREAITGFGTSGAKTAAGKAVVASGVRIIPKQENTFQVKFKYFNYTSTCNHSYPHLMGRYFIIIHITFAIYWDNSAHAVLEVPFDITPHTVMQVGVGDTRKRHNPARFMPTPEEGLDTGVDEKFELAGEVAATVVTYGLDVRGVLQCFFRVVRMESNQRAGWKTRIAFHC